MHPVLFTIHGFAVPSYGMALATGLFVGLLYGTVQARKDGLPADWAWDLGILAMIFGVLGGRLEYVRTHWERFVGHPAAIFALRDGGMVFYGGFLLTLASYVVYARWRRVPVIALFDMMAPSVGFGHAIGRFGCLAAGCCYGRPTDGPWAITFPTGGIAPSGVPLIPTQVHEILFNTAMGFLLVAVPRRFVGQRFALLLLLYPTFRVINEVFRGDAERGLVFGTPFTPGEVTSAVLVLVALALWRHASRAWPLPQAKPA